MAESCGGANTSSSSSSTSSSSSSSSAAIRGIVEGKPSADFEAKYPKLARMLALVGEERDEAKRESAIVFAEKLVALAAQENRDAATKDAGILIFERCAPEETRRKLASALATRSEEECDAQIDLLARSVPFSCEHDGTRSAHHRADHQRDDHRDDRTGR